MRLSYAAFLPLLLLSALVAAASPRPGFLDDPLADQDAERAIELMRAGDYARAREILGRIVVRRELARGLDHMTGGEPRDALVCFDHVLEVEPGNAEALYMRGRACFQAASQTPAGAQLFFEDALASFDAAWRRGYGVDAIFEASRSARMANQSERALELARRGTAELAGLEIVPELAQPAERTLAEAAFGRYVEVRQTGEDSEELFGLTEEALQKLLGRTPADAWSWQQLANLYQWRGDLERARTEAELGLEQLPEDALLHQRAAELTRMVGGRDAVIALFEGRIQRHPDVALGWWYSAVELVLRGCDAITAGTEARADFQLAEERFRSCRALESDYEADCRGYEAICRAGLGWSARARGELAEAERSFHSMEDAIERGLTWAYPPYLGSGIQGLQSLADDYYVEHEEEADAVANAVAIYDFLQAYLPDDGTIANNAGFFNRDLAVLLDQQAELALARARTKQDPSEAQAARTEANDLRELARERMERSWESYVRAATLAPRDARIQNDTGLIMAYYLRRDAKLAEEYILRAIALAEEQLGDEPYLASLDATMREDLPVALGDAYQNLGVLYLSMGRDPRRALEWFRKSLASGSAARPDVEEQWIPACEKMIAGDPDPLAAVENEIWLHQGR